MKTWTCENCGKQAESKWVPPFGWLTLKDPGEIIVCGSDCASTVFTEIKTQEDLAWST